MRSAFHGDRVRAGYSVHPANVTVAAFPVIGRGGEWPKMFRMPACDPVAIAIMGFGIFLAAALAFAL